jgi:tRNA G18 (ribose-2'-O)-methylase SpoU
MNDDIGVGPHPKPWPTDPQYDPQLLADGDARNVLDKYRYWTVEAIKQDLDKHRLPLEIAIENLQRDFNIGTIVRTANAFNVRTVHIIGKKQWNKRGAMVTDLYMNIEYHASVTDFIKATMGKKLIAVDIVEGAKDLADTQLPDDAVLVFGGEGPGLSPVMLTAADQIVKIDQHGSTRSVNVGVAAGIAMYMWLLQHPLKR